MNRPSWKRPSLNRPGGRGSQRARTLAAVVTIGVVLAACGSDDSSGTPGAASASAGGGSASSNVSDASSTSSAGQPKPGGTLRFAIASDPTCVDPQQAGSNASLNIGRQIVDSLTDQDPESGKI